MLFLALGNGFSLILPSAPAYLSHLIPPCLSPSFSFTLLLFAIMPSAMLTCHAVFLFLHEPKILLLAAEEVGSWWALAGRITATWRYWSIASRPSFQSCRLAANHSRQEPAREIKRTAKHWSCPEVNSWVVQAIVCAGDQQCSRLASLSSCIPHCLLEMLCVSQQYLRATLRIKCSLT